MPLFSFYAVKGICRSHFLNPLARMASDDRSTSFLSEDGSQSEVEPDSRAKEQVNLVEVSCRLLDLPEMHPRLLWDTIILAAAGVLEDRFHDLPRRMVLDVRDLPGFGSDELSLRIDPGGIDGDRITRLRRTYEPTRQVELAAIAIAGFGLHFAGHHEIRDVALRGSGADYLVGDDHYHLEIAGRTRRADFEIACQQKRERLTNHVGSAFLICVVEFE